MSVPRWEGMLPFGNHSERQVWPPSDVSAETAKPRRIAQKEEHPASPDARSAAELSTSVRSALRNSLKWCCVNCVSSAVASRIPSLRNPDSLRNPSLRTSNLPADVSRTGGLRIPEFAYPSASPKSALASVFKRIKRAARTEKFARMSERLAPQYQRSAFPFERADGPPARRRVTV